MPSSNAHAWNSKCISLNDLRNKEPGSLFFSSPERTSLNKFYWEDEHQNILENPLSPHLSLIIVCPKIKN